MNNRLISIVCGTALILATSSAVHAADMALKAPAPPPVWDWSGFSVGAGGSFNWTHFDQSLQGISGLISFFDGPVLIAVGQEGGPFFDFDRNKSGFAPDVQLGYMHRFAGDWLGGLKFTYKYANIDSAETVSIPQTGSGVLLRPPPVQAIPLTGFVQISPAEINLKHQFTAIATAGRAFGNVALYAGAGPALFDVETNFINAIPFATNTNNTFPTSFPITGFNNNWVWGAAAQVGAAYAFAPHWFVDVNYTFARSATLTIINNVPIQGQNGTTTDTGSAVLNTQERITNQSVMVTLNYQFH